METEPSYVAVVHTVAQWMDATRNKINKTILGMKDGKLL